MIKQVSHVNVWVHDQDEALAWYTEKLGFEVREDVTLPELGDFRWLTVGPVGQPDFALALMTVPGPPVFAEDTAQKIRDLMGLEVVVYMVRASYHQKPARRQLMETFGATVLPSPGDSTEVGRSFLDQDPDHPGSEATAVSEALEVVRSDPDARFAMGAFDNHVLLHQTVIGLEAREQLELVDR